MKTNILIFLSILTVNIIAFAQNGLPIKYSAYKAGANCIQEEAVLSGSPLLVGIGRQKTWTLRLNYAPGMTNKKILEVSAKSLNLKTNKIDEVKATSVFEKGPDGSDNYLLEIPVPKNFSKKEVLQTSIIVKTQFEDSADQKSIVVYLVPLKNQFRIYDMSRACFISNPPEITDKFEIHRSANGPQDVQYEDEYIQEIEDVSKLSYGILELSYYAGYQNLANLGTNPGKLSGKRYKFGYSVEYYKAKEYREKIEKNFKISYTFKVNPGYIGYIVPTLEEQYIPYKDVAFNECGQLKLTGDFNNIEKRVRSSYQLVSVEPKYEDNLDYVFKKINKEFKQYNTCRENTHEITSNSVDADIRSAQSRK